MRTQIIEKITGYLDNRVTQAELVAWAEELALDGFDGTAEEYAVVHRLGVADAENFGLSWDDLRQMIEQLGYHIHMQLEPI